MFDGMGDVLVGTFKILFPLAIIGLLCLIIGSCWAIYWLCMHVRII